MEEIRIILVKIQSIRKGRFVDAVPLFSPNGVPLPVLRNVPVALFGNAKNHIDWHITPGDIMPYFVVTFDLSSYISQGAINIMDTARRNNLNSGFILPVTIPNMKEILEFAENIRIIGDRLERGNIDLTGDCTQVGNINQTGNNAVTGAITATENITTPEDVVAGGKSLKGHKHKGVKAGNDISGGTA